MGRSKQFLLLAIQLVIILTQSSVEPYSYIGSTTSGTNVLYSNPTSPLSQGTPATSYVINYNSPKPAIPQILIGLHSYEQRGNMADSFFKMSITSSSLMSFQVQVMAAGTSLVYLLIISYVSLEDTGNAFYFIPFEYNSLSTVSTSTGARVETKACNFYILSGGNTLSNNSSLNAAYIYLHGFELQSVGNCYISLKIVIQNSISYDINIKTLFDCRIQYVKGVSVLINKGRFNTQNIFHYQQSIEFNTTIQSIGKPAHFSSYGHIFLGINLWKIQNTTAAGTVFKYNLYNTSNILGVSDSSFVTSIQYSYLFIATKQCISSYPYYQDSTKNACVSQCLQAQTQSPVQRVCLTCSAPCSQCYSIQTNCTSCINGYQLIDRTCSQIVVADYASDSKLYLIGLLGIIPIGIIFSIILISQEAKLPDKLIRLGRSACNRYILNYFNYLLFILYKFYNFYTNLSSFIQLILQFNISIRNCDNQVHFRNYHPARNYGLYNSSPPSTYGLMTPLLHFLVLFLLFPFLKSLRLLAHRIRIYCCFTILL